MRKHGNGTGWWCSDREMADGQRYGFRLLRAGEWTDPLPDPRSRRQPDGPLGLSQVYADGFTWTDDQWTGRILPGQSIYELHVGTFTPQGTFEGAEEKLDYLLELGVTTIEIMPVQPFGGNHNWGYDGVDWHCVHEGYGGPEGLKHLVNACHNKNIAVILDVVYNHFGPVGNFTPLFGPYTTSGATDWGDVVNFCGPGSDEVRRYVLDAARQWLTEFHIDGLRLDAVQTIVDTSATHILEELSILATEIEATTGLQKTLIAESDQNDPKLVAPRGGNGLGGFGLDAQWEDDLHHALHALTSGETHTYYEDFASVDALAQTVAHVFYHHGTFSSFRGRTHGRQLDTSATPAFRFLAYTTTHDQTGNRPAGDRPSQYLSAEKIVLKAAIVLSTPYTPMLFMGEEFGAQTPFPFFCSHCNEDLNRLTREGRQRQFRYQGFSEEAVATMPDPADEKTFASAKLDWNFTADNERILSAYKKLFQLRKKLKFTRPWLDQLTVEHTDNWIGFGYKDAFLVANLSDDTATAPFTGNLEYSLTEPAVSDAGTQLPPWSFAILTDVSRV
ncbi:malto-oligosyltrehalose trehalohydrolase [Corynebacterium pyruviciproducens ATCC BAA-1742]|uniref:Malto-oligosyltrehalose trehalohydrolase n=2 Tax=Corynebacterium pyruviciproducens TaxID=598660 RepID=S2ZIS3_9CORY|nr:malto-oligosyltrehalose trehalohydrolase [Corynebacterium pyruviciproducens ATCC BAA-1742]